MHEIFDNEIALLVSYDLQMFANIYFDEYCPKYFYEIGASSTGKYHPQFAQGEGGLVRHTKAVVMFAKELLEMNSYKYMRDEYKDYVILACLVHDTCKYGMTELDTKAYPDHERNAAELVARAWVDIFKEDPPALLTMAIKAHMGQWCCHSEDKPFTNIDRCVHLADYMASRSFIDIPSLSLDKVEGE